MKNTNNNFPIDICILPLIVILGLLAGLVAPYMFGNVDKARIKTTQTQISLLEKTLNKYRDDTGQFPTQVEGLKILTEKKDINGNSYLIKSVPKDAWDRPFNYRCPGVYNKTTFDLWSFGPDGKEGGEEDNRDITNWE